jgi:hypothetical protein
MIYLDLKEEILINDLSTKKILSHGNYTCEYYPNGQIKTFSLYLGSLGIINKGGLNSLPNNTYIGKWYKFNEAGEVIQTIDFEKDYKTNFLDIFLIARKKINELISKGKYKYSRGFPFFERNKNELGAFWQLYISENYYMIIDDLTDKVKEEVESADYDEVQKKFSKFMKPTDDYNKAMNNFFETNIL